MAGTVAVPEGIASPPTDELLKRTSSMYALVIYAARRARQINAYYSQLREGLLEYVGPLVDIEIGWALRTEFHGQGYASEIGREGLAFATDVLASQAVVSFTERHNIASRRVMERIGMTYTGQIRWRGLVEGQVEEQDDTPFAVYMTHLADP